MMKYILKRVLAYVIDIILVTTVVTFIVSNSYINKDYNKYTKKYDEYTKWEESYTDFTKNLDTASKNSYISKAEYAKLKKNTCIKYLKNYENKKITQNQLKKVTDNCERDYTKVSINYNYQIERLSIITSILSILFVLLYFVIIQYYLNGQTLGKKLTNLRVVSNNDKKLSLLNYLVRSLILNKGIIDILGIILILVLNKNSFIAYNKVIYVINSVIEMTILCMVLFDKNNRGLHDYLSNTKVIEENDKKIK